MCTVSEGSKTCPQLICIILYPSIKYQQILSIVKSHPSHDVALLTSYCSDACDTKVLQQQTELRRVTVEL